MKSILLSQLEATLPPQLEVPQELKQLYSWIEAEGLYKDTEAGLRMGFLYPPKFDAAATDGGREGGTSFLFMAMGKDETPWIGQDVPAFNDRICVFGNSGGDGSMCALWLADDGQTKIVHMGSGSGSDLCCVLAEKAVDFIRLLSIGYDEICWQEEFDVPPRQLDDFLVQPNVKFQEWVKHTFQVEIPATASEIVQHPESMDTEDPVDPFNRWCLQFQ